MNVDPILPYLSGLACITLFLGLLLKWFRQPFVVAYLVVGIVIGPSGLAIVPDSEILSRLGNIGVVLLLFFVGLDISPKDLAARWRIAFGGTALQVILSVACVALLGGCLGWTWAKSILIGFVIAMSSTAVVLKILREWNMEKLPVGRNAVVVTITQDLAVIPMVIVLGLLAGDAPSVSLLIRQGVGAVVIAGLLYGIMRVGAIRLPFASGLRDDHELQVYAALTICFGAAFLTGTLGLSTALGAFVGGLIVQSARGTRWIHDSLRSFQVVFLGLFFISVGLLIDMRFIVAHAALVFGLVGLALGLNLAINALVFRLLGVSWRESLFAGALLSQIGEFGFVLAGLGLRSGILLKPGYQTTVSVIALTLLISPLWISLFKRWAQPAQVACHPPELP